MQNKNVGVCVLAMLAGALPALAVAKAEGAQAGEVGSEEWFQMMRRADHNAAMLKALPGSNGQPVVPPDCVEISVLLNLAPGWIAKDKLPRIRILSTDDRVDNVPRSPFIFEKDGQTPYFYSVLKRDLAYEFYLQQGAREERMASWRVPAGAPKHLRLVVDVDARGAAKISEAGATRRKQ